MFFYLYYLRVFCFVFDFKVLLGWIIFVVDNGNFGGIVLCDIGFIGICYVGLVGL